MFNYLTRGSWIAAIRQFCKEKPIEQFWKSPACWPINNWKTPNFDIGKIFWTPLSLKLEMHPFDNDTDAIMSSMDLESQLFGSHGVLPGEILPIEPVPTTCVPPFTQKDPPSYEDHSLYQQTGTHLQNTPLVSQPVADSSRNSCLPNGPFQQTNETGVEKELTGTRVRVSSDSRQHVKMIYVQRSLTSWKQKGEYRKSKCQQCREAASKLHVVSLVPHRDVLIMIEGVVKLYVEYGFDKEVIKQKLIELLTSLQ